VVLKNASLVDRGSAREVQGTAEAACREAELLRRVQHVNVVQLLDVRLEPYSNILVLEWCIVDLELVGNWTESNTRC
jgi:hypothetical protein